MCFLKRWEYKRSACYHIKYLASWRLIAFSISFSGLWRSPVRQKTSSHVLRSLLKGWWGFEKGLFTELAVLFDMLRFWTYFCLDRHDPCVVYYSLHSGIMSCMVLSKDLSYSNGLEYELEALLRESMGAIEVLCQQFLFLIVFEIDDDKYLLRGGKASNMYL